MGLCKNERGFQKRKAFLAVLSKNSTLQFSRKCHSGGIVICITQLSVFWGPGGFFPFAIKGLPSAGLLFVSLVIVL